ncbi:hypothetical protein P692DRAFT_20738290, partial [Suillus brevipes Sb2]
MAIGTRRNPRALTPIPTSPDPLAGASPAPSPPSLALPTAPTQLRGNTLPESKVVATALRNNWGVHIPLSALSTKSLLQLGISSHAQSDSDQSLSVKEGVLTVTAPHFDRKSERTISVEEWSHAWPRLVSMIRRYLPSDQASAIADSWETHFTSLFARYDFFVNFPLYLKYDIRVRQSFVHDHSFSPADWQEEVWLAAVVPPQLPFGTPPSLPPHPRPPRQPRFPLALPPKSLSPHTSAFSAARQAAALVPVAPPAPPSPHLTPPPISGRHLRVSRFASSSMAEGARSPSPTVGVVTCASAVGALTLLRAAHNDGFLPVVTPFIWQKWREFLLRAGALEEFADVPKGIRYG